MDWPIPLVAAVAIAAAGALSPPATADSELPTCARSAAVINPDGVLGHPDCRLHSGDRVGLDFDVKYWAAYDEPPRAVQVKVIDSSGAVKQTIDELLEPTSPAPVGLEDLDGDGRAELIIPMNRVGFNGAPNTRFSVWRAAGDATHYERTQMVGQAVYPSGDGYVVTNGGALSSRDLNFYLPTGAGFTLIVSLTIEPEDVDPGSGRVLTVSCRAHQQQGLGSIDMDVRDAEAVFCASPAASAIWPGAERISI